MLQPAHIDARENPAERKDPGRKAGAAQGARRRAIRFHDGNSIASVAATAAGPAASSGRVSASRSATVLRGAEARLVDGDLERLLERHHQLDAFERAQAERIDRGLGGHAFGRARTARALRRRIVAARPPAGFCRSLLAVSHDLSSRRFSFCVPSVRGSSPLGPDRGGADLLVIAELQVGAAHDLVDVGARFEHQHRVNALGGGTGGRCADDRGFTNAWLRVQRLLDVFRKDVEPFRRDDHLLLAAADAQLAGAVDLADIAGVEPAIPKRRAGLFRRVEIAARHVLAAHENLAVVGNPDFDAGDRLCRRRLWWRGTDDSA